MWEVNKTHCRLGKRNARPGCMQQHSRRLGITARPLSLTGREAQACAESQTSNELSFLLQAHLPVCKLEGLRLPELSSPELERFSQVIGTQMRRVTVTST